jgi:hypothetical protein
VVLVVVGSPVDMIILSHPQGEASFGVPARVTLVIPPPSMVNVVQALTVGNVVDIESTTASVASNPVTVIPLPLEVPCDAEQSISNPLIGVANVMVIG